MGIDDFLIQLVKYWFQLISRRYEKSSTIFTSNKSYGEWGEIFKDHVIAAAVLDRILYHCTTINIKGESYRLKERKRVSDQGNGGTPSSTALCEPNTGILFFYYCRNISSNSAESICSMRCPKTP